MKLNGCYNRPPFVIHYKLSNGELQENFSHNKNDCQYTLSNLGQKDEKCHGCIWRKDQK